MKVSNKFGKIPVYAFIWGITSLCICGSVFTIVDLKGLNLSHFEEPSLLQRAYHAINQMGIFVVVLLLLKNIVHLN